ncbi:MAG: hypothetical protein U9R60_09620 [Bacteroidota bacterium]|nr:hypothetical protein [Bacteroidota bacterium]
MSGDRMAITKSEITDNTLQAHGQRYVVEKHFDHLGREHLVSYATEADKDLKLILLARVKFLDEMLVAQEITEKVTQVENGYPIGGLEFATSEEVKIACLSRKKEYEKEIADNTEIVANLAKEETA